MSDSTSSRPEEQESGFSQFGPNPTIGGMEAHFVMEGTRMGESSDEDVLSRFSSLRDTLVGLKDNRDFVDGLALALIMKRLNLKPDADFSRPVGCLLGIMFVEELTAIGKLQRLEFDVLAEMEELGGDVPHLKDLQRLNRLEWNARVRLEELCSEICSDKK